jgi:DNA-binding transcriptional LysR family regulator
MDLEVRHLRTLCAIADAGSVTRAAASVGVSQPALAAQLQRIERELGGLVFLRDRHGVTPTPLGQYILTRARGVLLAMDELRRGHPSAHVPAVRLGGIASHVSVGLADRLADHMPHLEVRLHSEYSPRVLWDLVLAGRLDAATIVDYPGFALRAPGSVSIDVIATEPVFVAVSDRHRLAERAEIDLAELAAEPWVLSPSDGAGWPECFNTACGEAGFAPRVLYTVSDAVPVRELVVMRRAIAPVQAGFAPGGGVAVRPLIGNPVRMRLLLVCRRDGLLAGIADQIIALAREAYWGYASRRPDYVAWLHRHDAVTV